MDRRIEKEMIVKSTLGVLQNFLPTNIMRNLDRLNEDEDSVSPSDDLNEDRFIYERLTAEVPPKLNSNESSADLEPIVKTEPAENGSLTYFEIVEQEMMRSLPVTRENIEVFTQILSRFDEFNASLVTSCNLQTEAQLANLFFYALMTDETSETTEQTLFLEAGTVNKLLRTLCQIITRKKDAFIAWPDRNEITKSVQQFESYQEFGHFEFYNVFGAIGTLEIHVRPAIRNYLSLLKSESTYTPIKWQCSSDSNGLLQSSYVMVPKLDKETKNSYIFEKNPVKRRLEAMKLDEIYLVADETLTLFPFLLTPHEKIIIHAEQHNRALDSKRKIIDKTFAVMQNRFAILTRIELRDADSIRNLIDTVGILHNFLVIHGDQLYMNE